MTDLLVPDAVVLEGRDNTDESSSSEQENCKVGRVYPGDMVVYKSLSPWDWSPTYGTVVVHRKVVTPEAVSLGDSTSANKVEERTPSDSALITVEEQPLTLTSLNINAPINKSKKGGGTVNDVQDDARLMGAGSSKARSRGIALDDENFTVHWDTSNRVRQMKRSEVCIIDRMLIRGTRVRNNEGVTGTVTNYNVKTTLQIVGTNHIIQGVSLNELYPISPYVRGQEILYKNWVGMVTNIKRKVWFRLDGGLTFHIETTESDGFMKTDPYWGLGVACPGVRTPFSPAILKNAKWTSKYMRWLWKWLPPISFLYSFSSATVSRVDAAALTIKWLAPAPNAANPSETPPEAVLDRSQMQEIQILSMLNSEYAGLNSVRVYKLKPEDQLTTYGAWFSQFRQQFMETSNRSHSNFFSTPTTPTKQLTGSTANEVPVKVLLRHNYVDIEWDNGSEDTMASIDVPFVYEPRLQTVPVDFRTGMVVLSENHLPESKMYGIVQPSEDLIEAGTNTLRVHWYAEGTEKERVVLDEGVTEESVYSLRAHPLYSLFQRETILFSTDPNFHEFNAGIVLDVDVRQGNMIVYCTDSKYRKVWPHMVTPLSKRCSWNFFTRKWVVDDIIPPPHQLGGVEQYPKDASLPSNVSEAEKALLKLKQGKSRGRLWQEPPFDVLEFAPENHWYNKPSVEQVVVDGDLAKIVRGEFDLMRSNVPEGVWVRVYENRMDLVSVLIVGPQRTPYEDGLFFFDFKLPKNFPKVPPQVHSIAYSTGEIHPRLGDDGNFCQSDLVKQWKYDSENEDAYQSKSYILEAIHTILGLFHTSEPYSFTDSVNVGPSASVSDRSEESRSYNEMIFLQVLDIYYKAALRPHAPWKRHITEHILTTLPVKLAVIDKWFHLGKDRKDPALLGNNSRAISTKIAEEPGYPLLPVSKGFKLTLDTKLKNLRSIIKICTTPDKVPETNNVAAPVSTLLAIKQHSQSLMSRIEDIFLVHSDKAREVPLADDDGKKKVDDPDNDDDAEENGFSIANF